MKIKSSVLFITCLYGLVVLSSVQAYSATRIPKSCLDLVQDKTPMDGYYRISDNNTNMFTVYCDFSSEPGSAWTLVMSWALKFKPLESFRSKPFMDDAPVNENSPNWVLYRLSHGRMQALKRYATHWRATCSFPEYKVDYRDYLRGSFKDLDITTYLGQGVCKKVEFINIRGNVGVHLTVPFWQLSGVLFHTDATANTSCSFRATRGVVPSGDRNSTQTQNKNFRCRANPSATTQYWFGGYY